MSTSHAYRSRKPSVIPFVRSVPATDAAGQSRQRYNRSRNRSATVAETLSDPLCGCLSDRRKHQSHSVAATGRATVAETVAATDAETGRRTKSRTSESVMYWFVSATFCDFFSRATLLKRTRRLCSFQSVARLKSRERKLHAHI